MNQKGIVLRPDIERKSEAVRLSLFNVCNRPYPLLV